MPTRNKKAEAMRKLAKLFKDLQKVISEEDRDFIGIAFGERKYTIVTYIPAESPLDGYLKALTGIVLLIKTLAEESKMPFEVLAISLLVVANAIRKGFEEETD